MHCWTIASGLVAFAGHLQLHAGTDANAVIAAATELLRARFGIEHVTIQPETLRVLNPLEEARPGI